MSLTQVVWKPVSLALADRGHQLTFVASVPDKDLSAHKNIDYVSLDVDATATVNSSQAFEGHIPANQCKWRHRHMSAGEYPLLNCLL